MLFNSYEFIFLFMPVAFAGYYLIARKSHSGAISWLAFVSLFFYAYWSLYSLPILLTSICFNYWLGAKLSDDSLKWRQFLLIFSLAVNLLVLAYFKYVNFFIDNANLIGGSLGMPPISFLNIVLPIGISFFTFTQIAFLMDSYRGKVQERNLVHYILFVTFFPHLIAGPVLHHRQMMPQFSDPNNFTINSQKITLGIIIFTVGLSKKLLIADPLGGYANILFDGVKNGVLPHLMMSWFGSLAYSFQLYFDFSGYSDMAIGLSLFFGIWLPINFNSPYKATSIIDFWQRWHISLTKYIGEYLYVPITLRLMRFSDGQSGVADTIFSLMLPTLLIFLILGLWHGPSWTYVLFGGMHGLFVVVNHLWRKIRLFKMLSISVHQKLAAMFGWCMMFLAVNISFVMFRSESLSIAKTIYKGMMGFNNQEFDLLSSSVAYLFSNVWGEAILKPNQSPENSIFLIGCSFLIVLVLPNTTSLLKSSQNGHGLCLVRYPAIALFFAFLFVLSVMNLGKTSPFLYFQF